MDKLNSLDIEFIKESFKWALMRMEDLHISNWGSYEQKVKRIEETKKRQQELLQKIS